MDKFPLIWAGVSAGELITERESLYTCFSARCRLPEEGQLWCAWAVGERGELRLGILEPAGEQAEIRRRFSDRMTAPLGRLLRGEIRPAKEAEDWIPAPSPEQLFRTPWLRRQLRGMAGVLTRRREGGRELALPYDPGRAFPLEQLFCFARLRQLGGEAYVVYLFDRQEWPVFENR